MDVYKIIKKESTSYEYTEFAHAVYELAGSEDFTKIDDLLRQINSSQNLTENQKNELKAMLFPGDDAPDVDFNAVCYKLKGFATDDKLSPEEKSRAARSFIVYQLPCTDFNFDNIKALINIASSSLNDNLIKELLREAKKTRKEWEEEIKKYANENGIDISEQVSTDEDCR